MSYEPRGLKPAQLQDYWAVTVAMRVNPSWEQVKREAGFYDPLPRSPIPEHSLYKNALGWGLWILIITGLLLLYHHFKTHPYRYPDPDPRVRPSKEPKWRRWIQRP